MTNRVWKREVPLDERLRAGRAPKPSPSSNLHSRNGDPQHQNFERSKQIVVKVATYQKIARGTKNTVRYIGEHGGEKDGILYDEQGSELTPDDAQERVDDWGLKKPEDNLSPAGRAADGQAFLELPDNEKYYTRQTLHKIISLPLRHDEISDETLKEYVTDYLKPFRETGHRAVFAIHRHQANPHVHIVMTTQGDDGRIRTNRTILNEWRENAVAVALSKGIDVENVRRIDREAVQRDVLKGRDQLQSGRKPSTPIKQTAPVWYSRWGHTFETTRAGEPEGTAIRPAAVEMPRMHPASHRVVENWATTQFADAAQARQSFLEMAAENNRTALWYARNQPRAFGPLNPNAQDKPKLGKVVFTKEWRADARNAINRAGQGPVNQSHIVRDATQALKAIGDNAVAANRQAAAVKAVQTRMVQTGKPIPAATAQPPGRPVPGLEKPLKDRGR